MQGAMCVVYTNTWPFRLFRTSRALQDRYGSTPLHVAARHGALRIVDAIATAQPGALAAIDVRGNTPLDNALAAGKSAAAAAITALGGLPGSHESLQAEQERIKKWAIDNEAATSKARLLRALRTLPEPELHANSLAIACAFREFTQVQALRLSRSIAASLHSPRAMPYSMIESSTPVALKAV